MTRAAAERVDAAAGLAELMEAIRKGRRAATLRGLRKRPTLADRDALVPYLESGLVVRDIARELGWDCGRVYRVADTYGLPVRGRPRPPMPDIAAVVEEMRPLDAVAYLIEAYRNLSGEDPERELQLIADHGFSPTQARIYALLDAQAGRIVPYERLALMFEQAGIEAADVMNNIKVQVSILRRRIREAGLPVIIETCWGVGFCLRHLEPAA